MKKLLLTIVTFVLISVGLNATNTQNNYNYYNNYNKQFSFVERGITFAVFQNGEFDFFLNQQNGISVNYNSQNAAISFNSGYNYNAYVQYDNFGAVIQIESTPIYYDYYGRVSKIGNVRINYNNNQLVQIGNMRVYYNNYGYYAYNRGYINTYNRYYTPYTNRNCFITPYYDYRVVSYKPYRHHYKPTRYGYYKDHSKNKYYSRNEKHYKNGHSKNYSKNEKRAVASNYGKRSDTPSRQRVATNIPKRKEHDVANNEVRRSNSAALFKDNGSNYDRIKNSSLKRNTSISKSRTPATTDRNAPTNTNKNHTNYHSNVRNPQRAIGERKPETKIQKSDKTLKRYERKPVSSKKATTVTSRSTNNDANKKRNTPTTRTSIKTASLKL